MKWGFFCDENESRPYKSVQDWYKETKHLIIPTIVMMVLGVASYLYFQFFHFQS